MAPVVFQVLNLERNGMQYKSNGCRNPLFFVLVVVESKTTPPPPPTRLFCFLKGELLIIF